VREVEVEVTLRPTVSRSVSLGVRRPSGTRDQFYFLFEIFFRQLRVCNFVAPSLTRRRVCNLLYKYFWALQEQSLLGRSPAELTAIFYCLIWDSPNLESQVPVFISPQEQGGPVILPGTVSFFVTSNDSLGYGRSILTRLHTGQRCVPGQVPVFISPRNRVTQIYPLALVSGQGQGYIATNSQSVSMSCCLAQSRTIDQSLLSPWISFRQLQVCNCVAPSLTRGQVCKLLYNCFWALQNFINLHRTQLQSFLFIYLFYF
jgi:hypothetical protein